MFEVHSFLSRFSGTGAWSTLPSGLRVHLLQEIYRKLISRRSDPDDVEFILGPRKTDIEGVQLVHQVLEPFFFILLLKKGARFHDLLVDSKQKDPVWLLLDNILETPGGLFIEIGRA